MLGLVDVDGVMVGNDDGMEEEDGVDVGFVVGNCVMVGEDDG